MDRVPSASFFSLPLSSWQQPLSARVAQYEHRKRRRDSEDWGGKDAYDAEAEATDASPASEVTPSGPDLVLSPNEVHQYRTAGLSFDKELPGGNFPHAVARGREGERPKKESEKNIMKGLSSLSPPLYPPQSAAQQGNVRLQHLAVLTAVLHRCLLQGDYARAGRAWGILLREEFSGRSVDVRVEGRWGIGAEILLRRGRQLSDMTSGTENSARQNPLRARDNSRLCFTKEGFEDAKKYYERLVIQYPFRKAAPDAISSLHFYPVMFGLWIYVVQEESNAAREELQHHRSGDPSQWASEEEEEEEEEETRSDFETGVSSRQKQKDSVAEIKENELEQAQQIAVRMDEILVSPPYSDSPELLELRGMVSLWIADLFVSCFPQEELDGYDSNDDSDVMVEEESILARRERRLAMERREVESQKSSGFFDKARQRGRGVTSNLEHLHIDDTPSLS